MPRSRLLGLLTEIHVLLVESGHDGQATYVATLLKKGADDDKTLRKGLVSVEMWGGSGAVWEVLPFNSPEDRRRFCQLIIELEAAMQEIGILDARAQEIAGIFQYWLNEGVI